MKFLVSFGSGLMAVVLLTVVANVTYVAWGKHVFREVPNVVVAWNPQVFIMFRDSPYSWAVALLTFALVFRLTLRRLNRYKAAP